MRRRDERGSERKLIAVFSAAGFVLFAGTLLVGFSLRDVERQTRPPVHVAPSAAWSANISG